LGRGERKEGTEGKGRQGWFVVFKTVLFNGFAAALHEMMYNLYF